MEIDTKEKEKLQQELMKIGLEVEREAKMLCPVDTGRLRASINTQENEGFGVTVGSNVDYAPYVEFGTSKMRPQPFLRPAIDKIKSKYGK